ncbi:excinuclease ABC subunit C [Brevundimonas sp. LM2]|uniref:GIY-YIG nuclease family protein n=1 Tax=Brevundimonas sp. LM2 TaxID=1938605 RepID=UPI000983966C|nr:GIY-YIG nuclease family protein [Brevundimonas sp. LM2]AQR62733.1 excinuclease ABC subunit C [Brevundimonas sp. LM2]
MRAHDYWVYILADGPCGWLYVGMTNDLIRRVDEHRQGEFDGYTRERGIYQLVWYERHQYVDQAILREKRIKRWRRPWKFALVETDNPRWLDLYGGFVLSRRPDQP